MVKWQVVVKIKNDLVWKIPNQKGLELYQLCGIPTHYTNCVLPRCLGKIIINGVMKRHIRQRPI